MNNRTYITATVGYNTCEKHVCAPVFRKEFSADKTERENAVIEISAVGFYRLFLNGNEITKGCLAPYVSNPDDIVYYDLYKVGDLLQGENVLCIMLGNGFANSLDGNVWNFESASFRCAPKVYACLRVGGKCVLSADGSFEVYDSPITFDDYRLGEFYDAGKERPEMFLYGYRGADSRPALIAEPPTGEYRLCKAQPIKECGVIFPVSVFASGDGFIYDFGQNNAGVCRLKINSRAGRKISLLHGELIKDGKLFMRNLLFKGRSREFYVQRDEYICKDGYQEWQPCFTYHGFRYVYVEGIDAEQATEDLLSFVIIRSDIPQAGEFGCDDGITNKIQECTLRSDASCFHYFPTDCPQREKNGWTADAALSCEQLLYNFDCAVSLREWLNNIRKAQTEQGALPGIVPTGGWGFSWGNGPAWDAVIAELPYQLYRFTGDKDIIRENAAAISLYFSYLKTKVNKDGLIGFGLGDWCEAACTADCGYSTPVEITDTLTVVSICRKTEFMFGETDLPCSEISSFRESLTVSFRKKYVRGGTLACGTQTAYAMAVSLGMFTGGNAELAYKELGRIVEKDGSFRVGVIGQKYLFPLLFERGDSELAFKIIKGPFFPSYGYWTEHGYTTLGETFTEFDESKYPREYARKDGLPTFGSLNHHFWGSVSALFYEHLAGLRVASADSIVIQPKFVSALRRAKAEYSAGSRTACVEWKRKEKTIELRVCAKGFDLSFDLPSEYKTVSKRKNVSGNATETIIELSP